MNKKAFFSLLTILIVFLYSSCNRAIGDWDDNIKLSKKSAIFSANGDSVTITTKGGTWWINSITLNNEVNWHPSSQLADSTSYNIKLDNFTIEKRDKNTLFIKAIVNSSTSEKSIKITLEAGDYFDYVTINQKSN